MLFICDAYLANTTSTHRGGFVVEIPWYIIPPKVLVGDIRITIRVFKRRYIITSLITGIYIF